MTVKTLYVFVSAASISVYVKKVGAGSCNCFPIDSRNFPTAKWALKSTKDFHFGFSHCMRRKIMWNLRIIFVCIKKLHFKMHL